MKTQNENRSATLNAHVAEPERPHGVNYSWTGRDGATYHGHTVASGRDESHAQRRFFRQHRHVMQAGGANVLVLVVVLALLVAGLAVNLALARGEVKQLKSALASSYAGQTYLVREVQTLAAPATNSPGVVK